LPKLTNLQTLVIVDGRVSLDIVQIVSKMTSLRVLGLSYAKKLHNYANTHAGSEVLQLTKLTNLVGLSVGYLSVANATALLSRLPALVNLHVSRISLESGQLEQLVKQDKRWANLFVKPLHANVQTHILATKLSDPEMVKTLLQVRPPHFTPGLCHPLGKILTCWSVI